MDLIPFVLTARQNKADLQLTGHEVSSHPPAVYLVDEPSSKAFGLILNHTNQLAFGGDTNMGMPLWVMLDCGILSCAVVGFALPREQVDEELATRLGVPEDYEGLVPISEYCACPTLQPGCVSGFSLQTQLPGRGIASRTKALALLYYGSIQQVGVTQFDNPAIRVHARFGPMQITVHRPTLHTHAANSFVYRLRLPGADGLAAIARGDFDSVEHDLPSGESWSFNINSDEDHARLAGLFAEGISVWIVAPGWRRDEQGECHINLCIER